MKKFLKGTLFFAALNLTYAGISYSQEVKEINYDEINEQVAKENRDKANSTLRKFVGMSNLYKFAATDMPKRKKLKGVDKQYKKFLRCAAKFARKKKGGDEGGKLLADITEKLFDGERLTEDSYTIKTVTQECKDAYRNLNSAKDIKIMMDDQSTNSSVNKFLSHLYSKKIKVCQAKSMSVAAGALFVAKAGLNTMKCLYQNGKVRNFAGVIAGIGMGVGAMISVSRKVYTDDSRNNVAGINFLLDSDWELDYALGPISNLPSNGQVEYEVHQSYEYYKRENVNFGLGVSAQSNAGNLNIQIWPSSTRWGYLLDLLK